MVNAVNAIAKRIYSIEQKHPAKPSIFLSLHLNRKNILQSNNRHHCTKICCVIVNIAAMIKHFYDFHEHVYGQKSDAQSQD